jgi:hypothetical protein
MNDYFASWLAHERQADYVREVEHDELVAQVHLVGRLRRAPGRARSTGGSAGRFLTMAVAAIALVLALAAPVAADNASYPGCSNFGAVATGDFAPGGALGALISSVAPRNPGVVSGIVQWEHGLYCAPR